MAGMATTPGTYQRIFGTGPRGLALSLASLVLALWLAPRLGLGPVHGSATAATVFFFAGALVTVVIVFWAVKSLPPGERGRTLVTTGAFRYFRHPLYGAFLIGFDGGLALYIDDWALVFWALAQFPLWHWNIRAEERLMAGIFPGEYEAYCRRTGRFFPRFWAST